MLMRKTFEQISSLIYDYSGMILDEKKIFYLEHRIKEHMKELGINSIKDYLILIKKDKEYLRELVSKSTVNETYFYREFHQLQAFGEILLPKTANIKERIRILSIPCSSGEEVYTLAIVCNEILGSLRKIEIWGVDIDYKVLLAAKKGIYGERSLSHLPENYINKYFNSLSHKEWEIKPFLKTRVRFKEGNILDYDFVKSLGLFDFIFCRNLLIYFDDKARKRAALNLYQILSPSGYLFLGHAESLSKICSLFLPTKVGEAICYIKVEEEEEI